MGGTPTKPIQEQSIPLRKEGLRYVPTYPSEFKSFGETVILESLVVRDVTPLLISHLYRNEEDEKKGKILVHNDYLVKFNNSIAPIIGDFYLMKYRCWYSTFLTKPLDYYRSLINYEDLERVESSWNTFKQSMAELWPLESIIETLSHDAPPLPPKPKGFVLEVLMLYLQDIKIVDIMPKKRKLSYYSIKEILTYFLSLGSELPFFPIEEITHLIERLVNFWQSLESLAWVYFIFVHFQTRWLENLEIILKGEYPDSVEIQTGINLVIQHDKNPHEWGIAGKKFPLHPSMIGWDSGLSNAGFSILHIDPRTKKIRVLREFLYMKLSTTEGESIESKSIGDSRIAQQLDKLWSYEGGKLKYNYFISSDCFVPPFRSSICLGKFFIETNMADLEKNQWSNAKIVFETRGNFVLDKYRLCGGVEEKSFISDQPIHPSEEKKSKEIVAAFAPGATTLDKKYFSPSIHGRNWSMFQCPATFGTPPFTEPSNLPCASRKEFNEYWELPELPEKEFYDIYFSTQFLPHNVVGVYPSNYCNLFLPFSEEEQKTLDEFYTFHGEYRFSLGTPAIVYSQYEFIAVGHSRFNADAKGLSPAKTKHFEEFKDRYRESRYFTPSLYYYFMYFYTFDTATFKIRRISHSFQVTTNDPYLLEFAVGLCNVSGNQDEFVISYGEGDVRTKLLFLNRRDIESLLVPIELMVTDPETHRFLKLLSAPPSSSTKSVRKRPGVFEGEEERKTRIRTD